MRYAWLGEIEKQFRKSKQPFSASQLRDLGRGALSNRFDDLAYAVTVKGLEMGGDSAEEFLFMRAQVLPPRQWERRMVCAAAAADLARRHGDTDLAGKAVEMLSGPFKDGSIVLTSEQVAEVVRLEQNKRKPDDSAPRYGALFSRPCNCPECRRGRGEAVPYDEVVEDDFAENDDDAFDDLDDLDIPDDMPPEIAALLLKETKKAIMTGESLEDLMARLFEMGLPRPTGPASKQPGKRHRR